MSTENKPKVQPRNHRVELRTNDEEIELFKRCADHFSSVGLVRSEVSEFIRNLVVLYAVEHSIPLFLGDLQGSAEESKDERKLQIQQAKIAEGVRRIKNRKVVVK